MQKQEYQIKDYRAVFSCSSEEPGAVLLEVRGRGSSLELPDVVIIEGKEYPLRVIGKKAVLGKVGLRQISLPGTVNRIEDWAFAQCENLEQVTIRKASGAQGVTREFGTGVFAEDIRLHRVFLEPESREGAELHQAVLLALALREMSAEDFLRDEEIGGLHWYQKWDQRLLHFLEEADAEGYTDMVLCGEEDIRQDMTGYMAQQCRKKAELCMVRLLHTTGLEPTVRQRLVDYVLQHSKGCESEAAWEVLLEQHGDEMEYYQLLLDIGGIHMGNVDAMMLDLKEWHPEAKAFLIRYQQEQLAGQDVFARFTL
jgi:hypothetical protein